MSVQEAFGAELGGALSVRVCGARVLCFDAALWAQIAELPKQLHPGSAQLDMAVAAVLDNFVVCILEFAAQAVPLDSPALTAQAIEAYFTRPDSQCPSDPSDPSDPALCRLHELGGLLCLDVLLNNVDRVPCGMWENQGNPGNLMLGPSSLVGIDNSCSPLPVGSAAASAYLARARALAADVSARGGAAACFSEAAAMLHAVSGWSMQGVHKAALCVGFARVLERATQLGHHGGVRACKEKVRAQVKYDWQHVWRDAVALIDPDFVAAVASALAPVLNAGLPRLQPAGSGTGIGGSPAPAREPERKSGPAEAAAAAVGGFQDAETQEGGPLLVAAVYSFLLFSPTPARAVCCAAVVVRHGGARAHASGEGARVGCGAGVAAPARCAGWAECAQAATPPIRSSCSRRRACSTACWPGCATFCCTTRVWACPPRCRARAV